MRRLLLSIAGLLILLAVAVPAGAIYYAAFTESGLKFIVSLVPREFAGVRLDIVNPSGTIARGIHVERVELDHHLVHLRFDGFEGRVALTPLLWQTIRSPDAYLRSAYIQVKRRTRPATPGGEPLFLPRWLIISAEHTRVGHAVLVVPNGYRLEGTEIVGSAVLRHRSIRFFEGQVQMGDAHFSGIGELRATDPLQLDVDGRINWSPDGQPAWTVFGTAKGDLDTLLVTAHTVIPFRCDFSGRALDLTNHWHWLGEAVVHDFDLRAWGVGGPLGIITGRLAVHGDSDGFGARGPVNPTGLHAGLFEGQFAGAYAAHVLTAKQMEVTHLGSGAHASGAGTIGIVPHGPRLGLHGSWRDFRWPLVGADILRSASGDFTLEGTLPYSVHASGIGGVPGLPAMPLQVDGTLGKDSFTFSRAAADLFDGHASLEGGLIWSPAQSWSLQGRASGIDPGRLRPDLPGKLNFTLAAHGQGFDRQGDITIEFHDVGGQLRGVAARGNGKLFRSATTWQFDGVRVGLGRASLALDGRVNSEIDLRFAVNAEDLSVLSADSRGQLKAAGTIRGTLADPTIAATAHGGGIHYDGITLEGFDADIDFDPRSQQDSRIEARLRNLTYRDRTFQSIVFTLGGQATDYAAHLEVKTIGLAATAQARGPYVHGLFQGQLGTLTVNGSQSLHLELERPVGLRLSAAAARLEWLCLVGTPASLCADADWSPGQWSTTLTANQLPINTLTSGLTPSVEYQGTINILARLFSSAQEPVEGSLRVELSDAQLSHRLLSHRVEHTTLGSGTVSVTATRSVISADAALEAGQVGTIKTRLSAQRGGTQWQDMPLQGELHAQTGELSLISLYMPDIDRAAGRLVADVQISGTLGTPFMSGMLKLSDAEIDLYQVNLGLRQLGLEAHLTDSGVDFNGSARVGSGTATAGGHLEWHNSLPRGKITLQGTNLRVVDIPEAQIDASPNLDFNVDGRKIEVTGAVRVPFAKIVPKDLTGAVRATPDEVIVGSAEEDPAKRFEVVSTITLTLGDRATIDTFGLTGRLGGSITVRSGYDAVTRATGELSIEEGKYTAYARKLDIQRGRLIFTGGPVDNPGVDIRAVKQYPDVTAGVNVRGTLLQPRISFFSEPSLPQSQIVSLIIPHGS